MKRSAFTAIEALLSIGIIAVTAGIAIPVYRNYQMRSDLDLAVEQTLQGLRRAQLLSQAGEQDSVWGFYVPEGTLYQGESYPVRTPEFDETYPLPPTIGVSGLTDVSFTRVDGMPVQAGDIVFQALNGEQRIITVRADGMLGSSGILPVEETSGTAGGDTGAAAGATGGGTASTTGGATGETTGGDTGATTGGETGSATGGGTSSPDGGSAGGESGGGESETCEDRFAVHADGVIETTGSVDARFEVLGSAITYGAGGPEVQVKVEGSLDGGATWTPFYGGQDVDGGEVQNVENLPSGTQIVLRINGRYSWLFNATYRTNDDTGHILVLRNGDDVPDYQAFGNQQGLPQFVKGIIGSHGKIAIGPYDAVILGELGSLSAASSDFQDVVILVRFSAKEGSCARATDAKFTVQFDRLHNSGQGNVTRRVYVGPYAIPYAEGQWIPLEVAGQVVTDTNLSENVPGLAVRREDGGIRIRALGSHPSDAHKEIVDARIIFDRAVIAEVQNESGQDATENPFDGIVNDGPGGDEVTLAQDHRSVLFQTRVTTADDGIVIRWNAASGDDGGATGDTGSADAGGAGGENGGETGSAAGGETGAETSGDDGGDSGGEEAPDPCAAAYTVESNGRIVLQETADLTFEVLGSHAALGQRGPEIQVRVDAGIGAAVHSLFGYRDVDGGERQTFRDVPAGTPVTLGVEGQYAWLFRQRARSDDGTNRIRIHRRGSALPGLAPYSNVAGLQRFLRNVIQGNTFRIDKKAVLFLVELQDVRSIADYQDLAVLLYIEKPASGGMCGSRSASEAGSSVASGAASSVSSTSSAFTGASSSAPASASSSSEPQMTICHYPPGDRRNPQTLTIGVSAWPSHEAHGDRRGACEADEDGDTVPNSEDLCPGTYMPEGVPRELMLFDRYALTQRNSPIFRVGPRKKVSDYNLEHTRGCSCEQIVDVAENVHAYHFTQYPSLHRNVRSLFPFYTMGARNTGCGRAILDMVRRGE